MSTLKRLLFIKSRRASFIELDQRLLADRFDLRALYQPGRFSDPRVVAREVRRADVIVGWWASWHTFLPFTLAWLLRKPTLLIVGGFDTAAEPELGYGYQLGGPRAWLSRFTMRRARVLMTNSEYSRAELERNTGISAARVHVVYHGIPDEEPAGGPLATGPPADPTSPARPLALSVGVVDHTNLERKGLRAFAQAATLVPECDFVIAGRIVAGAGAELERLRATNLQITGWLEDSELTALYRRADVYVQASRHEGFGVAVAESMLARCVPVVSRAGALPEVVGETGVLLDQISPSEVAAGVRGALRLGGGEQARARVLEHFSVERRQAGLLALLDALT